MGENTTTEYIVGLIKELDESDKDYDATIEEYKKNGIINRVVITIQRRGTLYLRGGRE